MKYEIKEVDHYKFIETGGCGENLLLLHGLFGALSNFETIIDAFVEEYNIVAPILPIFYLPIRKVSLEGLVNHVHDFVQHRQYDEINVLGNSLGGHIALLFALANPEKIKSIILTGSSGLFETAFGSSFPKRGDYDFIKKRTEETFFHPEVATKELVDEVFDIVNDRNKAIRIVATAKSAIRHNLKDKLHNLKAPTLLVWGKQDQITPAFVGEKFNELIDDSRLILIDECGHAPMMEHPKMFNGHLKQFLEALNMR